MLAHYLTIALRAFGRHKLHSALGVLSLAVGLWAFVAAYAFVAFLHSFEAGFPKSGRIYTVYQALSFPNGFALPMAPMTSAALAEHIAVDFPELEAVVRVNNTNAVTSVDGKESFRGIYGADAKFLDVFDLPFIAGDPKTALAPGSAVIAEDAARELFGTTDVLGRTLDCPQRRSRDRGRGREDSRPVSVRGFVPVGRLRAARVVAGLRTDRFAAARV